jgi:hypothetical protein
MIKKLSAIAVFTCLFSTAIAAGFSDTGNGERPQVRLLKNHQLVESRPMTDAELEVYQQLKVIEQELEAIEMPLDEFEDELDDKADQLETVVEAIVEAAINGQSSSSNNMNDEKTRLVTAIHELTNNMKPALSQIKGVAKRIKQTAAQLKEVVYQGRSEDEFDAIQVIDGDDSNTIHYGNHFFDTDNDDNSDDDNDFDF